MNWLSFLCRICRCWSNLLIRNIWSPNPPSTSQFAAVEIELRNGELSYARWSHLWATYLQSPSRICRQSYRIISIQQHFAITACQTKPLLLEWIVKVLVGSHTTQNLNSTSRHCREVIEELGGGIMIKIDEKTLVISVVVVLCVRHTTRPNAIRPSHWNVLWRPASNNTHHSTLCKKHNTGGDCKQINGHRRRIHHWTNHRLALLWGIPLSLLFQTSCLWLPLPLNGLLMDEW